MSPMLIGSVCMGLSMCAICDSFSGTGATIIPPMENRRGIQLDVREQKNVDRRRSYAEFLERLTQGVSTILESPPAASEASTRPSAIIAAPSGRGDRS
jgi:hypothetical protein